VKKIHGLIAVAATIWLTSGGMANAQRTELEPATRVVQLLEESGYRYAKETSWLWSLPFTGNNMPRVSVWVMTNNEELIVESVIARRDQVLSEPDVMRQLLMMNNRRDGPVLLVDEQGNYVARSRVALDALHEVAFQASVQAIVAATDAAYGAIKEFLADEIAARTIGVRSIFVVSSTATKRVNVLGGRASVSFNPARWKETRSAEQGQHSFQHANGAGFAVVVAEPIEIPSDQLRERALANMRRTASEVQVVDEQVRHVNGTNVLALLADVTINGVPYTYFCYYYGGPSGTVQLVTYTDRAKYEEYRPQFEEFLNGFRVGH
jgi:hypothetical protein